MNAVKQIEREVSHGCKGRNEKKKRRWTRDDTELTVLALPTTIWYFLFAFMPMFGIIIAFKDYKIKGGFLQSIIQSDWIGFQNFKFLFSAGDIWIILRNTILYNIAFIILNIVVPVTMALLIGQLHNKKMAKVYQTAMFMPYFLSWVVVTALVWAFLSFDKGLLNSLLESMGKDPHQWYMEPKLWPPFLIFMYMWKNLGYSMVVYLATITGIDKTYYEAAGIDGATVWQQMRYVTLPLMKTVIIMMFIMAVGRIFYSDFGLFYQVPRDSNSLYNVSYTLDVFVFKSEIIHHGHGLRSRVCAVGGGLYHHSDSQCHCA